MYYGAGKVTGFLMFVIFVVFLLMVWEREVGGKVETGTGEDLILLNAADLSFQTCVHSFIQASMAHLMLFFSSRPLLSPFLLKRCSSFR